ncbi:MAG: NADH-quinone oxidoreductase subunit A [Elusimicrobiota bacterium]
MTNALWVLPPVAFGLYLFLAWSLLRVCAGGPLHKSEAEKGEPYACGEEFSHAKIAPDYSEFFPFAIFFTLIHVAGLMLATLALSPAVGGLLGGVYLLAVGAVLAILFAR